MTHARMNVSNHGRERTVSHARRNAESGGNTRSESGLAYTRRTRSVGAAKSASKIRSRRLRTRRASVLACASIASASTSMSIIASSSSFARSSASSGESGGDESSAESSLAPSLSNAGVAGSRGVRMDDGIARDWDAGLIEHTLRGPPEDVSADETRVPLATRSPRSGRGNPHPGVRPDPATDATPDNDDRQLCLPALSDEDPNKSPPPAPGASGADPISNAQRRSGPSDHESADRAAGSRAARRRCEGTGGDRGRRPRIRGR